MTCPYTIISFIAWCMTLIIYVTITNMSQENIINSVEQKGDNPEKQESIKSLVEGSIQIGNDVKQIGAPEGVSFGADYNNGEYATNAGWANFKHDNKMQAIFMTPAVAKKLEEAEFKKIDAGVIDNNPDRFHAGQDSSSFQNMVAQVGAARQQEKNADERFLTKEAFAAKYGTE